MRQFLAVPLPENLKEELGMMTSYFQEIKGIKPVKHKNMHITLLFLGDKGSHNSIEKLRRISFKPFNLRTASVALFPIRRPRLLWINLDNSRELADLYEKVASIYNTKEKLRAHITLSRIKWLTGRDKNKLVEYTGYLNPFVRSFTVNKFNLYNSNLKPDGPEYEVIESFYADPAGE